MTIDSTEWPATRGRTLHAEPALWSDVFEIAELVRSAAPACVPMGPMEVWSRLPEFEVVRDERGAVVATAAARDIDGDRSELRGLAVSSAWRGLGLGRMLVVRAIRRARDRGRKLVCVTRQSRFFRRLGFHGIPLESVPPKRARSAASAGGSRRAMCFEMRLPLDDSSDRLGRTS